MYPTESELFSVAAGPRRLALALARRLRLQRRRRQDRHDRHEHPRRELLDMNNAQRLRLRRRLPLVGASTSYHDRNTMTIDAFDWIHRSGAEPAERAGRPAPPRRARRARLPVPDGVDVRARVPAPARVLREPGRGRAGSTRASPTTRCARPASRSPEIPAGQIGADGAHPVLLRQPRRDPRAACRSAAPRTA